MAKNSKSYRKSHILLLLLIFITLGIAVYILNAPQKTGSSVARSSFTTCANSNASVINCSASSPQNGSTLVAVIGTRGNASNRVSSINQTGATWARATQAVNEGGNTTEIWYTTSLSSASTNVTINLAESLNASAIITQYSGILTSGTIDKTANNTGNSENADTGTTTQTSQSNQLWVGGLTVNDIGTFGSPNNSFTKIAESASNGGANNSRNNTTYLEKIVTTTGTANTSASINAIEWSGAIATFNASGAPTQITFIDSPFNLTAGACSNALTLETQDSSGAAVNASSDLVIQIRANNPNSNASFYTTSDCTGSSVTTFSFNGNERSKTFYMKDTFASSGLSINAFKISGSDTLADDNLNYTTSAGPMARLGIRMPGQTLPFRDGKASGTPNNQVAGMSFSITEIRALDAFDNTITSYSGNKSIAYFGPANAPNNTAPLYTTNVNFSSGISTSILSTTLYKASDNVTLSATENGLYASATPIFRVNAAALSSFDLNISNTNVLAGSCADNTLDISAKDNYGNVRTIDTSTIILTSSAPGMIYYTNSSCTTAQSSFILSNGTLRLYWKPTKKAVGATITATKSGDTPYGTAGPITINPGNISSILVKLPGQSFVDGNGFSGAINFPGLRTPNATAGTNFEISLYAVDAYNNLVDSGPYNYSGTKNISWANSIAGSALNGQTPIFPASYVTFTNGASTSSLNATYYFAGIDRTVRADDLTTPLIGNTSANFTVLPDSASSYSLSASSPQKAGVTFNVAIVAKDSYANDLGNLYSAPAGTYVWSSTATNSPDGTSPVLGNLVNTDFINGTAVKAVTIYKAQSVTISAGEPSSSTVNGVSNSIIIQPGDISADANDSTVVGNASGFDSRAETITITLRDTWRNPIPNLNKANIIVSGSGSASVEQPITNTDANGVTTAQITWIAIGNYTVRAAISNAKLVQNDGFATDLDGYLDSIHSIIIYENHPSTRILGGTKIQSGTKIQ